MSAARRRIAEMLADGRSPTEIASALGLARNTVYYHRDKLRDDAAGRSEQPPAHLPPRARRSVESRAEVERLLAEGLGRTEIARRIKRRLLLENLKDGRCEGCGLHEWHGSPLALALHHINGDRHDNRLENLQLLCPNCHSQTENFSGRNMRRLHAV